jgi:ABC-type nitrate/sulfonate/bicarbonate transport system substrate-binding protein
LAPRGLRVIGAALLAGFTLLGWSGLDAPAGTPTKVRMSSSLSPPSPDSITPYVAVEKGFFGKQGLDVEIVEFRGDATHVRALLAGEVDVAINLGATEAMVAASKGAKIRLWVVPQPITPYHFVARKAAAVTLEGLSGKSIAVSGIGAISYHIPRIVLQRRGVDPDAVKYVALGSPADRFTALLAGRVDATVVTNLQAAKLARFPEIVRLAHVPAIVPEIPYEFGVARTEYIQTHGDVLHRLTRAVIEANRWIATNKAGTVEVARKILPEESVVDLAQAYDLADPRLWGVNGDLSEAAYTYTAEFLRQVGYMTAPVPYVEFFDRRFVDRALQELGRR